MSGLRDLRSFDALGRDLDQFSSEFRQLLHLFGQHIDSSVIDQCWNFGYSLEHGAWQVLLQSRVDEHDISASELNEYIFTLRQAPLERIEVLAKNHYAIQGLPGRLPCLLPVRALRCPGWPIAALPRRGFYTADGITWQLVLQSSEADIYWMSIIPKLDGQANPSGRQAELLPELLRHPTESWQQLHRLARYRGDYWGCRDDIMAFAPFAQFVAQLPDDDERHGYDDDPHPLVL